MIDMPHCLNLSVIYCFTVFSLLHSPGALGDRLTVLHSPDYVSFVNGQWPMSGEKIPDLVALTMGFSVQEVTSLLHDSH